MCYKQLPEDLKDDFDDASMADIEMLAAEELLNDDIEEEVT